MKCRIEIFYTDQSDRFEIINFTQAIHTSFTDHNNTITIEIECNNDAAKIAIANRAVKFAEAYRFHSIQFIKS